MVGELLAHVPREVLRILVLEIAADFLRAAVDRAALQPGVLIQARL
jgi:hypothetical protein